MAIRDAFLPEFDHEMGTTRKTLERVPETNTDWKPHDKSMTMGRLAGHLAELPTLVPPAFERESLDFRPPGAPPRQPNVMSSRAKASRRFRQERRRRPRRHRPIERRRSEKDLHPASRRKNYFLAPAHSRSSRLHPESYHPSPRPALSLSAPQQCRGSLYLRPISRRTKLIARPKHAQKKRLAIFAASRFNFRQSYRAYRCPPP